MNFIVSPKQKRIIDLALDGMTNQQIGLCLGNTEGGIEQNMVKIFRKIKEAGYVIESRAGLKQFTFTTRDRRLRGQEKASIGVYTLRAGDQTDNAC